ncbi:TolB family protein [Psychroserpens mesophilus]|uniref:TolB family protein n=1 Tax=Psychroserpens mesophilus TaxID=325473 RepID=UPI0009FEAC25|nr:PD40 domain-containing protein [Psychroserpens mesophilus]
MRHIFAIISLFAIGLGYSQSSDQIFYSSFRPQGWDIHMSKDNGKSFSPLTTNESLDYDAKISPDGNWVVFTSERLGKPQLFLKHVKGDTLPRLLIKSKSMQDQVDFSPDGKWIVFVSSHEGNAEIFKLPFKPNETLSINEAENLSNNKAGDFRPRFSNDGNSIAFSSDRAHLIKPHKFLVFAMQRTGDIFTMSSDGTNVKRLTDSEGWDGSPNWSKDDSKIIFYSNRFDNKPHLFQIDVNGNNESIITPETISGAISPLVINDDRILFTNENLSNGTLRILELNPVTKKIDSSRINEIHMMNIDYHNSGIMVIHGGKKLKETEANKGDFFGDILVKNHPVKDTIENINLSHFGIRRSFASPPTLNESKVIYSYNPARGFGDFITLYFYPLILLPCLALYWFVTGVFRSVKKRKDIAFWKHIVFSMLSVLVMVLLVYLLDKWVGFQALSMNTVRLKMISVLVVVLICLGLSYWFYKKRKSNANPIASLYKLYTLMLFGVALGIIYIVLFTGSFLQSTTSFFTVDYNSNKAQKLFDFRADKNFNPQSTSVIDTKFTPDGTALLFSVGSFRGHPNAQGAVYKYNLESKIIERITPMDSNHGFADVSADHRTMVFRSGETGNMDIYVNENGAVTNLTNSKAKENFPAISHDGNKIMYCSDVNGKDIQGLVKTMDVFLIERQSDNSWSSPKQITSYSGQEGHPHFSPDGNWMIYTTEEFGINDEQPIVQSVIFAPQMYGEIVAERISDGKKIRLTHNKWEEGVPLWISTKY